MKNDLISFIVPAKNRAKLIGQTLESVENQTSKDWECIVIDDGSTDGTLEIVAGYASRDGRFKSIPNDTGKRNANVCRNLGVQSARGEFVIFLDSDDLLMPRCAERRLAAIKSRPHLDFLSFFGERFRDLPGDIGTLWGHPSDEDMLDRFLKFTHPIQTTGPIFRAAFLRKPGNAWLESLPRWQDWEFMLRLALNGAKYDIAAVVDYYYRVAGPESICSARYEPEMAATLGRHLADIAKRFQSEGLLNEKRRVSFALLFLKLIEEMLHIRDGKSAMLLLQLYQSTAVGPDKLAKRIAQLVLWRRNPILRRFSYSYIYPKIALYKHANAETGRVPSYALAHAGESNSYECRTSSQELAPPGV